MKNIITREQTNNFNKENKFQGKTNLSHLLENKEKYFKTFGIPSDRRDKDYDTRLVSVDEYGAIIDQNNIKSNLMDLAVYIIVIIFGILLVTGIITYLTPNNPLRAIVVLIIIGILYLLYRNIKTFIFRLKSTRNNKFKLISAIEPIAIIVAILLIFSIMGGEGGDGIGLSENIDVNSDLESSTNDIIQLNEDNTKNKPYTTTINMTENLETLNENNMSTQSAPTPEENIEINEIVKTNIHTIINNALEEKNGWKLTESEIHYYTTNYERILFNIPKEDIKLNDHTIQIDTTQEATEYDNIKLANIDSGYVFLEMENEEKKQNIVLRINFNKNQIQTQ